MERKEAAVSTGVLAALLGMLIAEAEAIAIFDCGSGVWIQDGKPRHPVKTSCLVNFFLRLKDTRWMRVSSRNVSIMLSRRIQVRKKIDRLDGVS
jgi:hypothetical protein